MTKIADPKPPYCASCFNAVDEPHVDFEAAYDGPVIPGTPVPVPVDDLVICESCLEEAFNLLDPQGLRETIRELAQIVQDQQKEIHAKDKAIAGFRASTNELIDHPIKTFPGKPKLEGVPPEVREKITKARFARRGTTPAPKKKKVAA